MWAPGSRLWEPRPALVSLSFPALVCQVSAFTLHAWLGLNLQWKAQPLHPVRRPPGWGREGAGGRGQCLGDSSGRLHTRAAAQTFQDGFAPLTVLLMLKVLSGCFPNPLPLSTLLVFTSAVDSRITLC